MTFSIAASGDACAGRVTSRRLRRLPGLTAAALIICTGLFNAAPSSASEDTVASLLKQQTDAFADASSRGNQAILDSYLDDQVLFSGGNGQVDRDPKLDKNDSVSALLKQQTQAFRDAGQRGDTAAMKAYLDDEALFVNEDRIVYGARDFQGGAPAAAPKGVPSTVTISDWVVHYSGDVAVCSFIDDQVIRYEGQTLNPKFLSVETWIKRGDAWKLIGSQTIPLHQDPSAASVPSDNLDDYAGSYTAGPALSTVISRQGNLLYSSTNEGKPVRMRAEAHDVFFTTGLPAGYARAHIVFRRDSDGRITGYVGRRGVVFTKNHCIRYERRGAGPTTTHIVPAGAGRFRGARLGEGRRRDVYPPKDHLLRPNR
ncbi:MAG TPA: DUF4440 domain-containing protein [Blastocatellia bacterium]